MASTTEFRISGDRSILAVYGAGVDPQVNEKVRQLAALLHNSHGHGITAVVPSYCTLSVHYNPLETGFRELTSYLLQLEETIQEALVPQARTVVIPVCYGREFGPDIDFVASHNALSTAAVIELHSSTAYRIYAIGFAPGFCYLGGLDPRLHTPRLDSPRLKVVAGSVGIAGNQTGVYPLTSPGGWRLIGRTPLRLFAPERQNPLLYQPGDTIRFQPVSTEEYHLLLQKEQA